MTTRLFVDAIEFGLPVECNLDYMLAGEADPEVGVGWSLP